MSTTCSVMLPLLVGPRGWNIVDEDGVSELALGERVPFWDDGEGPCIVGSESVIVFFVFCV